MKSKHIIAACLIYCGIAAALLFTACSSDSDSSDNTPNETFTERLMGRWMCTAVDEMLCVTNYNYVLNFVSPTKAYRSFSPSPLQKLEGFWENRAECDVKLDGNKFTITAHYNSGITTESQYSVMSITDTDLMLVAKHNITNNGKIVKIPEHSTEHLKKITKDYSQDIIGTWEGRMTSNESMFDDGKLHRWEYKADGNYVYYTQEDDGQWVRYDNTYANYFVDGVLLCSRWKNNGEDTENREWWEIESIQNGVMKWTALRKHEDGTSYTASFQMTKVK